MNDMRKLMNIASGVSKSRRAPGLNESVDAEVEPPVDEEVKDDCEESVDESVYTFTEEDDDAELDADNDDFGTDTEDFGTDTDRIFDIGDDEGSDIGGIEEPVQDPGYMVGGGVPEDPEPLINDIMLATDRYEPEQLYQFPINVLKRIHAKVSGVDENTSAGGIAGGVASGSPSVGKRNDIYK